MTIYLKVPKMTWIKSRVNHTSLHPQQLIILILLTDRGFKAFGRPDINTNDSLEV